MDGGNEGTEAHGVTVDDVDAELKADQVCGSVAYGAGGERINQCASPESEVDQIHIACGRGQSRPDGTGEDRVGSVAYRAAVVQPHPTPNMRGWLDGDVCVQGDHLGDLRVG